MSTAALPLLFLSAVHLPICASFVGPPRAQIWSHQSFRAVLDDCRVPPFTVSKALSSREHRLLPAWEENSNKIPGLVCRRELLHNLLLYTLTIILTRTEVDAASFADNQNWGNQGTFREGREFAARSVRDLLQSKGLPTILKLNEAQQVLIEAWSAITCFSLTIQDFRSCPGGRDGWKGILIKEVEKLQEPATRPSGDAYAAINNVLLPAIGDRSSLLLLPEVLEEVEEIAAGDAVVGLGIAFVQPPSPSPGLRQRLKVLTVVPGSRAAKAGIRYGDRLVSIDGQDVGGTTGRDPGLLIPGPIGSTVDARFERDVPSGQGSPAAVPTGGATRTRTAAPPATTVRALLDRQPMAAQVISFSWLRLRGAAVAYLAVLTFAGPPVAKAASALLAPLRAAAPGTGMLDEGIGGGTPRAPPLLLDLRGNAGGSLSEAKALLDVIVGVSR